jgi:hypothetical protein
MSLFYGRSTDWLHSRAVVYLELLKHSRPPTVTEVPVWVANAALGDLETFCTIAEKHLFRRKMILTERGYIGLAPLHM